MAEDASEVGPMDYLVVEFALGQANFSGNIVRELVRAVDAGTIRLLDLVVLAKDASGMITAFEIDDLDGIDDIEGVGGLVAEIAEILTAKDFAHLAEAMQPGGTAGVVVWENRWATPLTSAVREAGGMVVATGRISTTSIADSIDADALDVDLVECVTSPRRPGTQPPPGRAHRRGVITAPVARSASTVVAAAIVQRGVIRRRADRRARRGRGDDIAHNG
jgi:hypothetical protein